MRFVLVGPAIEDNLAIGYLLGALRADGHDTEAAWLDDESQCRAIAARIASVQPDAVGLSISFQTSAPLFLRLAEELRSRGFDRHLVAGGHFASLAAERLLQSCPALDAVLCGEADATIVQFAEAVEGRRAMDSVGGIVLRSESGVRRGTPATKPADLDDLPFPARDQPSGQCLGVPTASLVASRGCRGHCTFCSIAAFGRMAGGGRRERSAANIAREMAVLRRDRGARFFVFQDDDFLVGESRSALARLEALRQAFDEEGLRDIAIAIKLRPDDLHPAVVPALVELGVAQVFLGIESGSARALTALGRGVTPEQNRRALALLQQPGLFVGSNLMLWQPDTTLEDLHAELRLLAAFPHQLFNFGRTEPYEGAPLTRMLAKQGRLRGDWLAYDYEVGDARAEYAFQLFRAALSGRREAGGAIPEGQRLGLEAALLMRLFPSSRAERHATRAGDLLDQLALSNRTLLERLVGCAENASGAELKRPELVGAALRQQIERDDASIRPELRDLLAAIEACATEAAFGAPATPRTSSLRRPATLAVAAAGALACATPSASRPAPAGPVPEAGDVAAASPAAEPRVPARTDVRLKLRTETHFVGGGPCRPAQELPSTIVADIELDPSAGTLDGIEAEGGNIAWGLIAPNGRRARVVASAGQTDGSAKLVALVRAVDGSVSRETGTFYKDQGFAFATQQELEQRRKYLAMRMQQEQRRMGCDPPGPMPAPPFVPPPSFTRDGNVEIAATGVTEGWATQFSLAFAVKGPKVQLQNGDCDQGVFVPGAPPRSSSGWEQEPQLPPNWFLGTYSPIPQSGVVRLAEGTSLCSIHFRRERAKGAADQHTARFGVQTAPDGVMTLVPAPQSTRGGKPKP